MRCPARRRAGNMLCCRLLRALHTTHACMLPASAQPEPFFSCAVRHAQTKTAPAKGCMARRGCGFTGGTAGLLRPAKAAARPQPPGSFWNTGPLPAPAPGSERVLSVCLAEPLLLPKVEYFFECSYVIFFFVSCRPQRIKQRYHGQKRTHSDAVPPHQQRKRDG